MGRPVLVYIDRAETVTLAYARVLQIAFPFLVTIAGPFPPAPAVRYSDSLPPVPYGGDSLPLPPSSAWLNLLPDGAVKRQFILDCTGCHQFDELRAMPNGRPRTEAEWRAAVVRMLAYAGPETNFPVISSAVDADRTAAWLATALRDRQPRAAQDAKRQPDARRYDVREFLVPEAADLPHDLAIDSAGHVVVTGMMSNQMYVLQPATGTWRQVPIPIERSTPRAVEIDRQGHWWVVLGAAGRLGRFDGERWQTYDVGLYAHSVALDSAGGAYVNGHFTRDPELIVGVDSSGAVRRYPLPRHPTLAQRPGGPIPYEIRTAPDGALWMSELQGDRLIRLDPRNGQVESVTLPGTSRGPRRFDVDPRGMLWIPAYASGELLRYDPSRRRFDTIALPIRDALPYVVRVDAARDVVWIGTGAADAILAYYPKSRRFDAIELPTRGALVRHLAIDPRTRALWVAYGEAPGKAAARIARIVAPAID